MTGGTVLVEILGGHGHVRSRERVRLDEASRFTIGRGVGADVVLEDPHVASLHATVEVGSDGTIRVTDLGTINGVIVSGQRHHGAHHLVAPGGEFRLGRTMLRIRTAEQAVAPERPDHTAASPSSAAAWVALACGLASGAYVVYASWLNAPRDLVSDSVTALLTAVSIAGVWIGVWALLSRILLGEWRWIQHAAILFGVVAGFIVVGTALDLAWFSLTLPKWESRHTLFATALFVVALYQHLQHATHLLRWRTASIAILLPVVLVGAGIWVKWRAEERNVNHIGMGERFFPPELRLRDAADAGDFFSKVRALKAEADRKREAVRADDEDEAPGQD